MGHLSNAQPGARSQIGAGHLGATRTKEVRTMTTVKEMYDELAAADAQYDEATMGPKDLGLPLHGYVVRAENEDGTDGGVQPFLAPSWEQAEHDAEESLTASGHPDWHIVAHVTMPDAVLLLDALTTEDAELVSA